MNFRNNTDELGAGNFNARSAYCIVRLFIFMIYDLYSHNGVRKILVFVFNR